MAQALVVERWTSDREEEEIHFFVPGERNKYLIGWNPDLIDEQKICNLLAEIGYTVPAY